MAGYTRDDLVSFVPQHDTFVGIDSDGCVFDTMGVKQKQHFHPLIIKYWNLEAIEPQLRQAAEFTNLYSVWRGQNRFPALLKCFQLLHSWPEVVATGVTLPDARALEGYVNSGLPLGTPSLMQYVAERADPELDRLLEWTLAVNKSIAEEMLPVPPFEWARKALERTHGVSDAIVVSQTPEEALVNEWHRHGVAKYVSLIAGQELGTKAEHLQMAAGGKYAAGRVLMVGDAIGDRDAASAAGVLFYPINPGAEEASWERFCREALDSFLEGTYDGTYQDNVISEFEALLPDKAPWEHEG